LINESLRNFNILPPISLLQLVVALLLTTVLTGLLGQVYVRTHSGLSYSRTFVQTLALLGITIALIMVIIGSNIARAFALVGALSIIRFRNPVKDPRDIAFLFAAMAIGMACGTRFYLFALIFGLFFSFVTVLFEATRFGELTEVAHVLRIRMEAASREGVERICRELCRQVTMVSIDQAGGEGAMQDVLYEVVLRKRTTYEALVRRLTAVSPKLSIHLLVGESGVGF